MLLRASGLLVFVIIFSLGSASCSGGSSATQAAIVHPELIRLWPGRPPGTEDWAGPEQEADAELPNVGKIHVITNVTIPTLTVFRAPAGLANGTGVIVVPGGAFRALPWDLDGTETARWLMQHGITAFVLKYRVRPPPVGVPGDRTFDDFVRRTTAARAVAVADAEQAVGLVRRRSKEFAIQPNRIGMIGFSAGAMTAVIAATAQDSFRRPNFTASLYGAYLGNSDPSNAGPLFIVAAQDDLEVDVTKSVDLFTRWTRAKLPAEIHIYERGGHGFAFRAHGLPADHWPDAFEAWLAKRGYLTRTDRKRQGTATARPNSFVGSADVHAHTKREVSFGMSRLNIG
ncbi:MAG TPA: dienelactone hydrolase family protein [Sphingomicrobium sp.]|nr:dienelactone hydrolase family protein [Sphingomicrobium sp.]